MSSTKLMACALLTLGCAAAQAPLPTLRIEPAPGGSILFIKNTYTAPVTAYMIEMPDYPGSYYVLFIDIPDGEPIAAGEELRKPITNMTVGAAPEYVKMQAAIFADGATAGVAEKVTMLVERRHAILAAVRELIARLEKGQTAAELKQWSDGLPAIPRNRSRSQEAVNQAVLRGYIARASSRLEAGGAAQVLANLRAQERILAAAKP
ncbi:MAG TPA: hypothetical protein VKE70_08655 [Candidatus Solibacter sp.]|nr:hypothetical protein [Candidatus Solibacter sp.]